MNKDLVADFIAAFKNAIARNKTYMDFPASKFIGEILKIMEKHHYIENFKKISDNKQGFFRIFPAYNGDKPVLKGAKKISKSSRRVYVTAGKIPKVLDGYGIAIISTSAGVMEGSDAKNASRGGEVICYLW